jgi:uncharacterized protein (DUF4415 family)
MKCHRRHDKKPLECFTEMCWWHMPLPRKQITTVRVDSDVLLRLKGQGKGYQTRINAILREAMLRNIGHKA